MSAEHFCKAPILLLLTVTASTLSIAGAFSLQPIGIPVSSMQMPMTRMSSAFASSSRIHTARCGSVGRNVFPAQSRAGDFTLRPLAQASALHLAITSSDSSPSSGDNNGDGLSESSTSDSNAPRRGIFYPLRATLRGITGFSLTALRASLRAATGISITSTTKAFVGLFPLWFRYFMQPFLVLYYAPLMLMRSWVGETRTSKAEKRAAHEKLVEGWKHAIEVAEAAQANEYWPIHVDADGNIVTSMPPEPEDVWTQSPLNEAVLESVEVADAIENE